MDPVTIISLVAFVGQLIAATAKFVQYLDAVKDAPKERAKLSREAARLLVLFTDLRYRAEETTDDDPWFSGLKSLAVKNGPLDAFKESMNDLAVKFEPVQGVIKLARKLRWPLEKKEIDRILAKIERLKSLIYLALQKDQFTLAKAIKKDTAKATAGIDRLQLDNEARKIRGWLDGPDPSTNHNAA
ncbi:hypothetical protein MMC25_008237 [Agyrium rufum]|nr:hypothetical protein [Agyrium rufum]